MSVIKFYLLQSVCKQKTNIMRSLYKSWLFYTLAIYKLYLEGARITKSWWQNQEIYEFILSFALKLAFPSAQTKNQPSTVRGTQKPILHTVGLVSLRTWRSVGGYNPGMKEGCLGPSPNESNAFCAMLSSISSKNDSRFPTFPYLFQIFGSLFNLATLLGFEGNLAMQITHN